MITLKKTGSYNCLRNLFMVMFLFISFSYATAQDADYDFSGNWKSNQGPIVLISKSGDSFKGENVEHNKVVLEDLKYTDGKWTGVLIKPQDGSRYDCTAVVNGNKLEFTVRKGLFSKTITWIKQ
ncbi:MAG TPA: DUF2147 domain-containing protein [Ignavibacteria bacterium]|nr:DUF2147 domain-containing protein [Ignavibacteria bacterium]HMR38961.1 DUF2147 domain-containing protein [Ignavibacteria bacterium]